MFCLNFSVRRRLLNQTAQAVERERRLKEAERLYLNLRQVLAKQPGPGLQEELVKTQRALKLRGDKLKVRFFLNIAGNLLTIILYIQENSSLGMFFKTQNSNLSIFMYVLHTGCHLQLQILI